MDVCIAQPYLYMRSKVPYAASISQDVCKMILFIGSPPEEMWAWEKLAGYGKWMCTTQQQQKIKSRRKIQKDLLPPTAAAFVRGERERVEIRDLASSSSSSTAESGAKRGLLLQPRGRNPPVEQSCAKRKRRNLSPSSLSPSPSPSIISLASRLL